MRCVIIADIHANLLAFVSVLNDIEQQGDVEEVWCLGDIVGYGPDPHQCIELLRQTNNICVAGNHDLAAINKIPTYQFNPDAVEAIEWTATQLTARDRAYLGALPTVIEKGDFTLVHGSPREPVWEYIASISAASENFSYFNTKFCLASHSHVPSVFRRDNAGVCHFDQVSADKPIKLGKERLIINPGAVGQPRDGDKRASYAIYDSDKAQINFYRVAYDISVTQARMVEKKLPVRLVARLSQGV